MRQIFILTLVTIFVDLAQARDLRPILLLEGDKFFCAGDFNRAQEAYSAVPRGYPEYFAARLGTLSSPAVLVEAVRKASDLNLAVDVLDESERIFLGFALRAADPSNIDPLLKLLNFQAKDKIIQAYQNILRSSLIASAKPLEARALQVEAFNSLPYIVGALLESIASLSLSTKDLASFVSYIDLFPVGSPTRLILKAYRELAEEANSQSVLADVRSAHGQCPYSVEWSLFYVSRLLMSDARDESEVVLLKIVETFPYYSGYVDLYLADIYFKEKRFEEFKYFLSRAESKSAYMDAQAQHVIGDMKKFKFSDSWLRGFLAIGAAVMIFFCVMILFVKSWRKKTPLE